MIKSVKIILYIITNNMNKLLRNTKMMIFFVFAIFSNVLIMNPLREACQLMGGKISAYEPFVAMTNSGVVVLILPLLFIVVNSDFPDNSEFSYFVHIRSGKKNWMYGEIAYAFLSSVVITAIVFGISVLLMSNRLQFSNDYSDTLTKLVTTFPEKRNMYVTQLIQENMYNQMSLLSAFIHSFVLLVLYFFVLGLINLLSCVLNNRLAGTVINVFVILLGSVGCAIRHKLMWFFPMANTISWLHYDKYISYNTYSISYSYAYFEVLILSLIVAIRIFLKRYQINL